jgi:hypothetical protein
MKKLMKAFVALLWAVARKPVGDVRLPVTEVTERMRSKKPVAYVRASKPNVVHEETVDLDSLELSQPLTAEEKEKVYASGRFAEMTLRNAGL